MPERARKSDNQSWFMHPSSLPEYLQREKECEREIRLGRWTEKHKEKRESNEDKERKTKNKIGVNGIIGFFPFDLKLKKR